MNIVDVIVIVSAVVFAWSGWRQGFVAGLLSFIGFIGGGLIGTQLAPHIVSALSVTGTGRLVLTVVIVFLCAGLGQVGLTTLARFLRRYMLWRPFRLVDNAAGAVLNVVALAVVCWIVASAVATVPDSTLARDVRESKTLGALDSIVPNSARTWFASLQHLFEQSGLPRVFAGFAQQPSVPVVAPDPAVLNLPAVRADLASVVKVSGIASACRSEITGSGFVFAPEHVMTNAHVVLGVAHPTVRVEGVGSALPAITVYLDTSTDVAVLWVPGLRAKSLTFGPKATTGQSSVVVGFPGGGPLTLTAARVREEIRAIGTDLYGRPGVSRDVYALRTTVHPGNSGGPLLATDGTVLGVVFATSIEDPQTGYALTDSQVATARSHGSDTSATSPGACIAG